MYIARPLQTILFDFMHQRSKAHKVPLMYSFKILSLIIHHPSKHEHLKHVFPPLVVSSFSNMHAWYDGGKRLQKHPVKKKKRKKKVKKHSIQENIFQGRNNRYCLIFVFRLKQRGQDHNIE